MKGLLKGGVLFQGLFKGFLSFLRLIFRGRILLLVCLRLCQWASIFVYSNKFFFGGCPMLFKAYLADLLGATLRHKPVKIRI